MKTLFKIDGNQAKIETRCLLNINVEHYCFTVFLCPQHNS